ncbi:MAG: O-acetyl-ADP-ribose deacetylase [Chloroflexota bacterium]|nr:O-acetyl-ADP-ribose deacetylase [Chloroflexota bacterium]
MSKTILQQNLPGGQSLAICQGDLTAEAVDAIVNAANAQLAHGGGVAAAISRAGGPAIQRQSNQWVQQHGPAGHDHPAYTTGGDMPCRYVIHAVGPVWGSGDEKTKLAAAIRSSLALAEQLKLGSIAFPAISTGIFGFPKDLAAAIFMQAIPAYLEKNPNGTMKLVKIVLYDTPSLSVFEEAFRKEFELG